ncbi:MAG: tRNA lysidine(34) synthetase TilS [Kiritimatiellae bacterium]|nr:tRNA lysidine(34) synthetase TilS [Kiritimatiellia bacterium]
MSGAALTIEERFAAAMASCIDGRVAPDCPKQVMRRLGLAVSGGSDSMALFHLAAQWCKDNGVDAVVLCFDHAIEGENSAEEAKFVCAAAEALGLELVVERADPPVREGNGKSLEMAARDARRAFYMRAAEAHRLDAIATGHQRDDVAETVLLRLLRGAGAAGLSGLRPNSHASRPDSRALPHVPTLRPLLGFSRYELRQWLQSRGKSWMEDVANSNLKIPRCRMRMRGIPALAAAMGEEEGRIVEALAQSAAILREEDGLLAQLADDWLAAHGGIDAPLSLGALCNEPLALARRVVREWLLRHAGAEATGFETVEALLAMPRGGTLNLPGGAIADIDAQGYVLTRGSPVLTRELCPACPLPLSGSVSWGAYAIATSPCATVERTREAPGAWPASCTLSARAICAAGGLSVRGRRPGDRMRPFGIDGSRKLQDIFVDCKIDESLRDAWPVICAGEEIAWIPGYRIAAPFAVADGEEVVRIEVNKL